MTGALGQSLVATFLGVGVAAAFGIPVKSGLVMGMALAVASTVVLMRVLMDSRMLDTTHGHVAVGWLIVEDVLTVIVLLVIPALGGNPGGHGAESGSGHGLWLSILISLVKLAALAVLLLLAGPRVIPWIMVRVARLRSRELFTLTVLVMAIAIAAGSALLFGTSMALGAFLAGLVVGQSPVSHQAAADALPLRDAFAVLFFASVGMLFDPVAVLHHPGLTLGCLAIVLIAKPLAALANYRDARLSGAHGDHRRAGLGANRRVFVHPRVARPQPGTGQRADAECDCGQRLISITLNPMLFRQLDRIERLLKGRTEFLAAAESPRDCPEGCDQYRHNKGFGRAREGTGGRAGLWPGRSIRRRDPAPADLETLVVDLNMDTVQSLKRQERLAIYGDAYNIEVLADALPAATHLGHYSSARRQSQSADRGGKIDQAGHQSFRPARYISEREELMQAGATAACYEEAEAAAALAKLVMADRGVDESTAQREIGSIRRKYVAT